MTREVAADLAELAKRMEANVDPQQVAQFLMRCIFTMFAEDVGLLKEHLFTQALETRWILNPKTFKPEVEALWEAMNEGTSFGFHGKLLRFNGGLFAESQAFALTKAQLEVLLQAAKRDWCNVEPAIFGTLLERALDSRERSKLGAHYTPRSYVERLVKPVVMEPLGDRWIAVQAEVKQLLNAGESEPTANQRKKASSVLEAFLTELQQVKILDPACGSGNFLYVTLDLLKGLESEVLRRLEDVTGSAQLLLDIAQVNPSQFLGIELNPRAAAIADLVIWIGYLQWHFRRFGDIPPIEPVLREYNNIECRDAVLAYDAREPDVDAAGKVRTRWGGRMMKSPVTGEDIPDPTDKVTIYRYLNPRAAEWQEADYIVSNPPFIGTKKVLEMLGCKYVEALRKTYPSLPATIDYVMYWWERCALLVKSKKVNAFGLITTNSIGQIENRKILQSHTNSNNLVSLFFAIGDHPWVDGGANVRIAMTALKQGNAEGRAGIIINESKENTSDESANFLQIEWKVGKISDDLKVGIDTTKTIKLSANYGLCNQGCKLVQRRRKKGEDWEQGFLLRAATAKTYGFGIRTDNIIKPYITGEDITGVSRNSFVIDFHGLTREQAITIHPEGYQRILEQVKHFRDQNNMPRRRDYWWVFGAPAERMRESVQNLSQYIVTSEVAKHRVFVFTDSQTLADGSTFVFAFDDAYFLGILSSRIHVTWSLAAGGRLGVGNDPRYNNTVCFDPFPFPDPTGTQKQTIRELGERLDSHRKRVQATHPEVTITGMYNLLEKLRQGEPLDDKDKAFNQKALVSTLKQIHDELDAAVFAAYGWEPTFTDDQILENLVTLNAQRAEEERNGLIRWLRPDYQAPGETYVQPSLAGITTETETLIAPTEQQPFPKTLKEQLSAIRDLFRTQSGEWTATQVTAHFKAANRKQKVILDCLESLEDLGILLSHTENGMTFWHLAEL